MFINCENLAGYLSNFSLVLGCDTIKSGAVRIATPFTYPNGSHIDLFLKSKDNLFEDFTLSDFGQTAEYLLEIGFDIWKTKRRRQLVTDVCTALGIYQESGAFFTEITKDTIGDLPSFMVKLSQACIRIADLSFIQRLQSYTTFDSEVEEFIAGQDLFYEPEFDIKGKYDNPVKVSFLVKGKSTASFVQTLSTRNPTTSHITANEVFRKWFDLQSFQTESQFITVYDNNSRGIKDEDLYRLDEYSTVLGFPNERDQIAEALAA